MKKILLTVLALLLVFAANAQNVEFTKEAFPNDKKGLKEAKKNMEAGEKFLAEGLYREAYEPLSKAYNFNPNNAKLNYDLFKCTYNLKKESESFSYLNRAYTLDPNVDPDIVYFKGMERQASYDFEKAIEFYNAVPAQSKWKKTAEKRIRDCLFGQNSIGRQVRCFIDNVGGSINTQYDEYNPVVTADGRMIYFTSRRAYKKAKFSDDGNYFENIFYSKQSGDDNWTPSIMVEGINNLKDHDAVQGITVDGRKMLIYRQQRRAPNGRSPKP